jgi:mono/diheme cytochrome c family protein
MVTSRNGMVVGAVGIALLVVWLFRFGGVQALSQDTGHGAHGTPAGWRFIWPAGDPTRGRDVFVKYECFSCHEVRGEPFAVPTDAGNVGPELAAMGPAHEGEYFVEAIINPTAVVERGKGYEAADGSSKMPSFNDTLTVQELIDLVAYLKALRPPPAAPGAVDGQGGHATH